MPDTLIAPTAQVLGELEPLPNTCKDPKRSCFIEFTKFEDTTSSARAVHPDLVRFFRFLRTFLQAQLATRTFIAFIAFFSLFCRN